MKRITEFVLAEIRGWPAWWQAEQGVRRYGLPAFVLTQWTILALIGGLRPDHITVGLLVNALWFGGHALRTLFYFLLPVYLTGVVYDSQRFYGHLIKGTIHVAFPYEFDKRFFGIDTPEGRLTPNEFWQLHTRPWLDFVCGFFYLFFITIYVAVSFHQRFILPVTSKKPAQRLRARQIGNGVTWGFFILNVIGYSTYYWFPAAPPWYVVKYGFGPAVANALPSAAGCLRFDEMLGISVFANMYSKSADVFGAIPSLHISYPLLCMLFAYHLGSLRAFTTFFYLVMCFSAVYLNHHYLIDLLWGSTYSVIVFWIILACVRRKTRIQAPLRSDLL